MEDRLDLNVDSEAPERARKFVSAFADRHRVSREDRSRLIVIVEELITNLVKYGYPPDGAAGTATLELMLHGDLLTIGFEDDGRPFDPTAYRAEGLEAALDARPDGQVGLHMVQSLAHEMTYRRDGARNRLTLVRRVSRLECGL